MKNLLLLLFIGVLISCNNKLNEIQGVDENIDIELAFNEAVTLLDNKNYSQAKEKFLQLEKLSPELVGIKMNLSLIEQKIGTKEQSIKYAEEAFKLAPNNVAIAKYLHSLTEDVKYKEAILELENRVLQVNSQTYFLNFLNKSPIVNSEYANFEIAIEGLVTDKDLDRHILYLEGTGQSKEESVQCLHLPTDYFKSIEKGDIISFIGFSFGQGEDLADPIIFFRRMK